MPAHDKKKPQLTFRGTAQTPVRMKLYGLKFRNRPRSHHMEGRLSARLASANHAHQIHLISHGYSSIPRLPTSVQGANPFIHINVASREQFFLYSTWRIEYIEEMPQSQVSTFAVQGSPMGTGYQASGPAEHASGWPHPTCQ